MHKPFLQSLTRVLKVAVFGKEGVAPGLLQAPRGVAVDEHNNIIVVDTDNHRLQVSFLCVLVSERVLLINSNNQTHMHDRFCVHTYQTDTCAHVFMF